MTAQRKVAMWEALMLSKVLFPGATQEGHRCLVLYRDKIPCDGQQGAQPWACTLNRSLGKWPHPGVVKQAGKRKPCHVWKG